MIKILGLLVGVLFSFPSLGDIVLEGDKVGHSAPYYAVNTGCGLSFDDGEVFGVSYFQYSSWQRDPFCRPHQRHHCRGGRFPETEFYNEYYRLDDVFETERIKKKKWNLYVRTSENERVKVGTVKKSIFGKRVKLKKSTSQLSCGPDHLTMTVFE